MLLYLGANRKASSLVTQADWKFKAAACAQNGA
jgi:hypothetical protein